MGQYGLPTWIQQDIPPLSISGDAPCSDLVESWKMLPDSREGIKHLKSATATTDLHSLRLQRLSHEK